MGALLVSLVFVTGTQAAIIGTIADLNEDVMEIQDANAPGYDPTSPSFGNWSYGVGPNAAHISPKEENSLGWVPAVYSETVATTVELFHDPADPVLSGAESLIFYNDSEGVLEGVPDEYHGLAIGGWIHPPKIRWTAPSDLTVQMVGTFTGGNIADVLVSIIKNDVVDGFLFSEIGFGTTDVTFDVCTEVLADDTIDFVLREASNFSVSHTGVDVVIYEVDVCEEDPVTCEEQNIFYPGDINQDCYVNLEDFSSLVNDWLKCNDPCEAPGCPPM